MQALSWEHTVYFPKDTFSCIKVALIHGNPHLKLEVSEHSWGQLMIQLKMTKNEL
uniref:Uncharacterized protein n=1 Tax=Anguilla anguilla TaxID=7936 RepID=A0A0E9QYQ3_ANGAN